jgi:hypothetical protein
MVGGLSHATMIPRAIMLANTLISEASNRIEVLNNFAAQIASDKCERDAMGPPTQVGLEQPAPYAWAGRPYKNSLTFAVTI